MSSPRAMARIARLKLAEARGNQAHRLLSLQTSKRGFSQLPMLRSQSSPAGEYSPVQVGIPESARRRIPLQERLSLKGKVSVVTGGARGIGLEIVEALAEQGSDVAILDLLDSQTDLTALEKTYGTKVKFYKTDVTDKEGLESSFYQAVSDFGHIDKCVTAAGIVVEKSFLEHTWDDGARVLNVNVRSAISDTGRPPIDFGMQVLGTYFAAQLAAQQMVKQGKGGSIVMIASVASYTAMPSQRVSIYSASKAAVRLLAAVLGVEMAPHNIRINSLSPGFIETEMSGSITVANPDLHRIFRTTPPMERIGQPADLTAGVVYLLSDAAPYTTGADLPITGALHCGRIKT